MCFIAFALTAALPDQTRPTRTLDFTVYSHLYSQWSDGFDEVRRFRLDLDLLLGEQAMSADGLITLHSSFGPKETICRLEAEVRASGMMVFCHIDHAAGAAAVGLSLRPAYLLIFGAARAGTPLMQLLNTIGIDLPLKALVWQDEAGDTFLSYNDPAHIVHRHGGGEAAKPAVDAMSAALRDLAEKSTTSR
jgi:uncharacterized protein (DUF302 family)